MYKPACPAFFMPGNWVVIQRVEGSRATAFICYDSADYL